VKCAISNLILIAQILSGGIKGSKNGRSKGSKDGHSKGSKSKSSKGGGYYKYGGYWSSGSSEVRASLADITQLRAEIDKLIIDSERELIPKFLRLGAFGLSLCAFQLI
jgi:hypothetical protein